MKHGALLRFRKIVASVEFLNHESFRGLELFKSKVILKDGSNLRIMEKYRHGALVYYSYYWLDTSNELIIGWDNAPHHPKLKTFPHHKHLAGQSKPVASNECDLGAVLSAIAERLA